MQQCTINATTHRHCMKKISLKDLAGRLGNKKTAQLIGVDTTTVWRWLAYGVDVFVNMEDGDAVSYSVTKEVCINHH